MLLVIACSFNRFSVVVVVVLSVCAIILSRFCARTQCRIHLTLVALFNTVKSLLTLFFGVLLPLRAFIIVFFGHNFNEIERQKIEVNFDHVELRFRNELCLRRQIIIKKKRSQVNMTLRLMESKETKEMKKNRIQ